MLSVDGSGNGTILKIKGVFSMEQAPECWGKFDQCGRLCEFAAACRLCTETESRMDRALGGQEFDSVAEWAPDLMPWDCKKKLLLLVHEIICGMLKRTEITGQATRGSKGHENRLSAMRNTI